MTTKKFQDDKKYKFICEKCDYYGNKLSQLQTTFNNQKT